VVAAEHVAEPFLSDTASFTHGITFGGHPVQAAIALANLEVMRRERMVEGVREREQAFYDTLAPLLDLPIIGDIRGEGYFWALELVKDKDSKQGFTADEREALLRGFLMPRMFEAGMIARADDRGDPVIQLSPPLIAGQEEFDRIAGVLGDVLTEAGERFGIRSSAAV
jgi:adenosylmethionine-8-amino-7-oxononanoate aminotransferase